MDNKNDINNLLDDLFNEDFTKKDIIKKEEVVVTSINNRVPVKKQIINKNTRLFIIILVLFILLASTGYALYNETLRIEGTIGANNKIDFETKCNIINRNNISTGEGMCTVNKNKIDMKSTLYLPTDTVYYNITVKNTGTIPIKLSDIIKDNNDKNNILYFNESNYLKAMYVIYYRKNKYNSIYDYPNKYMVLNPNEEIIFIVENKWVSAPDGIKQPEINAQGEEIDFSMTLNFIQSLD